MTMTIRIRRQPLGAATPSASSRSPTTILRLVYLRTSGTAHSGRLSSARWSRVRPALRSRVFHFDTGNPCEDRSTKRHAYGNRSNQQQYFQPVHTGHRHRHRKARRPHVVQRDYPGADDLQTWFGGDSAAYKEDITDLAASTCGKVQGVRQNGLYDFFSANSRVISPKKVRAFENAGRWEYTPFFNISRKRHVNNNYWKVTLAEATNGGWARRRTISTSRSSPSRASRSTPAGSRSACGSTFRASTPAPEARHPATSSTTWPSRSRRSEASAATPSP